MTDWSSFTPTDQSRKHRRALKKIYNPAIFFKNNVKFSCLIFNIFTFCKSVYNFFLFSIQTKYFPQRNVNSDLLLNSNQQDQLRCMPLKATNLLRGIPVLTNLKRSRQVFTSRGSFVCHSLKICSDIRRNSANFCMSSWVNSKLYWFNVSFENLKLCYF